MINYIGFYDEKLSKENRFRTLSATNKMNYIIEVLLKNSEKIKIISPAWTNNEKSYNKVSKEIQKNVQLEMPYTIPWKGKMRKVASIIYSNLWLLYYLIFRIKKNEKVIVYHSLYLMIPIIIAKKINKFELILELEEKYQDVEEIPNILKKSENKIIQIADKYILATELLKEVISKDKKFIICNGTYIVEKEFKEKFKDNKIHIVYSGVIDKIKKGAFKAIDVGLYLNKNYKIHILGFGEKKVIDELNEKIKENLTKTECQISYDGLLQGEEYNRFLQKCDIGLSTQNPNGKYNNTSFPSKILTYLSNGLRVVSVKIDVVKNSAISSLMYYYEKDDEKEIANVIKNINLNQEYHSRNIMKKLDDEFIIQLKELIKGNKND